uniref:ZP domain-containing protein n=1 Tax=Caenorhabditis tropicalis TaxID=1561998 RepID=A0A1I7T0L2_9PELO
MERDSQSVDAFVVSNNTELSAYFAFSRTIRRDLIIEYTHVPDGVDILGKWIRARVRDENVVCGGVLIINNLFENRVKSGTPEIKIKISHDGRFRGIELYYHDYFGLISDPRNVISNPQPDDVYHVWVTRHKEPGTNSRWRISFNQDCVNPITNRLREVEGIVHSCASDGDGYIAWSKAVPRNRIFISYDHCPKEDLLGAWVDMSINQSNHVKKSITVFRDLYETRLRSNVVEIFIEFKCVETSPGIFYHEYFGDICDPRNMLEFPEIGKVYSGWIAYHQIEGTNARWRLALKQNVKGPLSCERNDSLDRDNYDEYKSRELCLERVGNRDFSPDRFSSRRNSSPDIVNEYSISNRSTRHSSRVESRQALNNDDSYRNSSKSGNYYDHDDFSEKRSSSRPQQNDNNRNHTYSINDRDEYQDDISRNGEDKHENLRYNVTRTPPQNGKQTHRSRSKTPQTSSNRRSPEVYGSVYRGTDYYQQYPSSSAHVLISFNGPTRSRSSSSSRSTVSKAETTDSEDITDESRQIRGFSITGNPDITQKRSTCTIDVKNCSPDDRTNQDVQEPKDAPCISKTHSESKTTDFTPKTPKSSEEKELLRCRSKLIQIGKWVDFFTADERISEKMRQIDSQSYEYLKSLSSEARKEMLRRKPVEEDEEK